MNKTLGILAYHRILPATNHIFSHEMDADRFDNLLKKLKKKFLILPLSEALESLNGKGGASRIVSITFDDGYRDNYETALPILLKHEIKATVFVASGFFENRWMWNDGIVKAISETRLGKINLEDFGCLDLSTAEHRFKAIERLLHTIKYYPVQKRINSADSILDACHVLPPEKLMMEEKHVSALHQAGMEIGGHTVSHPILANLSFQDAFNEIGSNKNHLEKIIQAPVHVFAYPNGKPSTDFTDETVKIVKKVGYKNAVTTVSNIATNRSDPFQLPRFTPWDKNVYKYMFRLWVKMTADSFKNL